MSVLVDIVVILIFFLVPIAVAGLYLPKLLLVELRDGKMGCMKVGLIFFGSILLLPLVIYAGSAISPVIPKSFLLAFIIFIFFFHAGLYFISLIRGIQLKKEDILLDLGRRESKFYLLFSAFCLIGPIISILNFLFWGEIDLENVIVAAMFATMSLRYFVFSFSKVYLTKEGIFRFGGTIKWSYITDYSWGKRKKDRINLTFNNITFSVRADQQADIDRIIFTRLGWHLRQDIKQSLPQPTVAQTALGS